MKKIIQFQINYQISLNKMDFTLYLKRNQLNIFHLITKNFILIYQQSNFNLKKKDIINLNINMDSRLKESYDKLKSVDPVKFAKCDLKIKYAA